MIRYILFLSWSVFQQCTISLSRICWLSLLLFNMKEMTLRLFHKNSLVWMLIYIFFLFFHIKVAENVLFLSSLMHLPIVGKLIQFIEQYSRTAQRKRSIYRLCLYSTFSKFSVNFWCIIRPITCRRYFIWITWKNLNFFWLIWTCCSNFL